MPKWTDYTIKTNPADKDEVMILDTAGKANKRLGLSALSDWIIGKIANKVFKNLQTQNKTILGALNELNSNALKLFYKGEITNNPATVKMVAGFYLVATYRPGGYKISSLSLVNIQKQDGSFIKTLVKGENYDATINMSCTEENIAFQYKIKLEGGCIINIFKLSEV